MKKNTIPLKMKNNIRNKGKIHQILNPNNSQISTQFTSLTPNQHSSSNEDYPRDEQGFIIWPLDNAT